MKNIGISLYYRNYKAISYSIKELSKFLHEFYCVKFATRTNMWTI